VKAVLATLLLLSALTSVSVAQGDDEVLTRPSLVGLKGVFVLVEDLPDVAERAGLSKTQLQTDVELRLRQGGVPVLSQEQRRTAPGNPTLYVNVNVLQVSPEFYAFSALMELEQNVQLLRAPSITQVGVPTWSATGTLGTWSRDNFSDKVRQRVKDMTDQFVNAYLAVNPKR